MKWVNNFLIDENDWVVAEYLPATGELRIDGDHTLTALRNMIRLVEWRNGYPSPPYAYN